MDAFLRVIAILLEVLVLSAVVYCMLNGVRLILADFGVGGRYTRGIVLGLAAAASILLVFFVAHLTIFYPSI